MKKTFFLFAGRIINAAHVTVISHDDDYIYLHMDGDTHYTENYEGRPDACIERWQGLLSDLM